MSLAARSDDVPRLQARTVAVDPPDDLIGCLTDAAGCIWMHEGEGLVGWGEAARVHIGAGRGRFDDAAGRLEALFAGAEVDDEVVAPGTGLVAFGSFTFDPLAQGSSLVVPRGALGVRGGRAWLTLVAGEGPPGPPTETHDPGRVRYAGSTQSEVAWVEAVARAVDAARAREVEKVVLARDLIVWSERALDARVLARRLSERFPSCFTFSCAGLVGATPELLIRRVGHSVESLVLAGTAARGATRDQDEAVGARLLASHKDAAEHAPTVRSVVARLNDLCSALTADPHPFLLRLANVQHLATSVKGTLAEGVSALRLAGALHPTAAVCGAPSHRALELIRSLEAMERSRYAGPVGWVDARGDGEWGIALRCAELSGTRARLFAGSGIVADSLPEAELEETRLKLRAMQSALES